MNLKQFKYVLVLSETNSFSKAAEELNISQPSLSQYVKNVEKEIGQDLFVRNGSNVRLTDAGKAYINAGRRILDIEHQMQTELTDISDEKKGSIIVGISPYRSVHLMPQVVKKFHAVHPGIKLVLDERSGYELIDGANRGEYDIFITTPPVNLRSFKFEHMVDEELILAVSVESDLYHRLKKASETMLGRKFPAVDINIINGEDFITLGDYMPVKIRTDEICDSYGLTLNTTLEVRSNEALISSVTSGVGLAIVPDCLHHFDEEEKRIAFFSFKQDIPKRELIIAHRKDQHLSTPIKDLIDIMKTI